MTKGRTSFKNIIAALALAGLFILRIPVVGRSLISLFDNGLWSVGLASLAAELVLLSATGIALLGIFTVWIWVRWIGRGVGIYWVFLTGAYLFSGSHPRTIDMVLFAAGGFLLISLAPPAEEKSPSTGIGENIRSLLRGWTAAFTVAVIPAILGVSTSAVATSLGLSLLVHGFLVASLAACGAVGVVIIPWTRVVGALLCWATSLGAFLLFRTAMSDAGLGHRELMVILPALLVSGVTLLVLGYAFLREYRRG